MPTLRRRRYVLAGLLILVALLATVLLFEVLGTVFFAITVAYVLLPIRNRLVARGIGRRWASAAATTLAFVVVLLVVAPLAIVLYRRLGGLFVLLGSLPETVVLEFLGFTYTVDVGAVLETVRSTLQTLALEVASVAPVLALKLTLFVFVVYALLVAPDDVRSAMYALVPPAYHDVVARLDDRIRSTLFALYVLQAATAAATFVVALVVFGGLGYQGAFALAVVAGILQFIPVVGPSLLVGLLAVYDLVFGMPVRAVALAILGIVFVGFLPDAVIRPRLARRTAHLPASVYFIGFTGGVLSVGPIGVIAGPLVVAMMVELVELLSEDHYTPGRE